MPEGLTRRLNVWAFLSSSDKYELEFFCAFVVWLRGRKHHKDNSKCGRTSLDLNLILFPCNFAKL